MDDVSDVVAFYDASAGQEQERLERHQLERDLTWRYLARYLPPAATILEVGAATGSYTVELVRRGYRVTAVDLSPIQLAKCESRLAEQGLEGRARLVVADARDLSAVPGEAYDAVLLMGPLYHLVREADRRLALQQAE
jgi:S-adenosylmethionine-dependent methyltransferase